MGKTKIKYPLKRNYLKTIAIKFCGGCNPTYDRVEYWEKIKSETADKITWTGADYPDVKAALVICGCQTACPEKNFDPARYSKLLVVRDQEMVPEEIIKKIITWGEV
jgi:hypothetical protein